MIEPISGRPIRRILCIDGGGILGVCPAAFLEALEQDLDQPIGSYFDLIAGTSTGGILALGLGLGMSAAELLTLYSERGPYIFGHTGSIGGRLQKYSRNLKALFGPKHDAGRLRQEIQGALKDRRLGDAKTRLLIPSWDPDHQSVYIFKTAHHVRLKTDYKRHAVDVAMATAAAPTYFQRHRFEDGTGLLDGGVWCNNPIAVAVVEAIAFCGWRPADLRILSLGCTNEIYSLREAPGWTEMASDITRLFLDGQSKGALGIAKLLTGHEYERDAIFRICPNVPRGLFSLDDTSKITQLRGFGSSAARKARIRIEPVFFHTPAEPFVPVYS